MRNGVLDHDPRTARSSAGIDTGGGLHVDRLSLYGYWQGAKSRRAFNVLNESPLASGHRPSTPPPGGPRPRPPRTASRSSSGRFRPRRRTPTSSARPRRSSPAARPRSRPTALCSSRAERRRPRCRPRPRSARPSRVRFATLPDWPGGRHGRLGGGPLLVRNGKAIFKAGESIPVARPRASRSRATAVGQRADGRIVLAHRRRRPARRRHDELRARRRRSRRSAPSRAWRSRAGRRAGMAFDGQAAQHGPAPAARRRSPTRCSSSTPASTPRRRPRRSCLPNGDGVAETESFTYKVVRPSTVTVQLEGPDGVLRRRHGDAARARHATRSSGTRVAPTARPSRRVPGRSPSARSTTSAAPRASSRPSRSTTRSARRRRSQPR